MAAPKPDVHTVPGLPGSVTDAVSRVGWLEDWRLAALLITIAVGTSVAWTAAAVRGRRAGRRPRHPWLRRLGLGCLVALTLLTGTGVAVNSYAGYAPDLSALERAVPSLVGVRSTGSVPATSGLASTGGHRPALVALLLSDPADGIPPGRTWVYLPPGYDDPANAARRYPVIYLIHGYPSSSFDWFGAGRAGNTAALMQRDGLLGPMILVAPDASGGILQDTECLDSTTGGPRLETFLTRTVVSTVDRRFRTIRERSGRAIGGVSSGGYCALNLGLRHQQEFGAVLGIMPYGDPGRNAIRSMLGGDRTLARDNSPADYAGTIPLRYLQSIFLAAGKDDPETHTVVEQMARTLGHRGDYVAMRTNRGLGHNWREARAELPYALAFASTRLTPAQVPAHAGLPGGPRAGAALAASSRTH